MLTSKKGNFTIEGDKEGVKIKLVDGTKFQDQVLEKDDIFRLKRSIEKWQLIVDLLDFGIDVYSDGGAGTCALCIKYEPFAGERRCDGCPVYGDTGIKGCDGTGYSEFHELDNMAGRLIGAQHELDFLKRLLKEEQAKTKISAGPF